MKNIFAKGFLTLACTTLLALLALPADAKRPKELWLGADISGTTADEARGVFSTDTAGVVTENTQLMKDYDLNAVRLRVWVNPEGGWSSKEDVLTMAKRAKALGMEVMIDFHYSDWWADPGKQNIPAAWKDMTLEEMKAALADHTRQTLQLLKDNEIDIKWVQIGNETTNGFLWPIAKFGEPDGMANYAALSNAGYDAAKEVYPETICITHLDNGFDSEMYNRLFDGLLAEGCKFDMIGMSVYPFWAIEGGKEPDAASTLRHSVENIKALKKKYGCDVMIVETGVASWQPEEGREFMNDLFDAVINDCEGACPGVFYWAPEIFQVRGEDGQMHGYSLGAFQDGHPTVIMDSYPRAAKIFNSPENPDPEN